MLLVALALLQPYPDSPALAPDRDAPTPSSLYKESPPAYPTAPLLRPEPPSARDLALLEVPDQKPRDDSELFFVWLLLGLAPLLLLCVVLSSLLRRR